MDTITLRFIDTSVPHLCVKDIKCLMVNDGMVTFYTSTKEAREDYMFPLTSIMYTKIREEY